MVRTWMRENFARYRFRLSEWNYTRRHLPDINEHRKTKLFATIITRVGFLAKSVLYAAIGVIAIIAATTSSQRPEGPQSVIQSLRTSFGEVVVFIFVIGLFCYCLFAVMYSIFDFDQIGHKGLGNKLKRFGRLFSAGFYAFIGAAGVQILLNVREGSSLSSALVAAMFQNWAGKGALCFLGIVFLVVSLVYFVYIWKPAKFRKELAGERMSHKLFTFCTIIARIGALGRSLFFASFGAVLIMSVAEVNQDKPGDLNILGLEGVLTRIGRDSPRFLFVIGILLIFYSMWAFALCLFRRLPAHRTERDALNAIGLNKRIKSLRQEVELTRVREMYDIKKEEGKEINIDMNELQNPVGSGDTDINSDKNKLDNVIPDAVQVDIVPIPLSPNEYNDQGVAAS